MYPTDRKEIFNEAYYEALENGKSQEQAEKIANNAMEDRESAMIDEAMDILKYANLYLPKE
jgi:hypothetical protein